ncbi:MAG: apolipoprotein N-acyltransferase [Desulfovibrionaceae bacterium]|nr:apolipoprotein N-acyltransferase [Desulfovibrionaceae bacterium]
MNMNKYAIGAAAALSLWLGLANPLCHIPWLILLHPMALLFLGQSSPSGGKAFCRGWLASTLGWSGVLYWIAVPVHDFGALPWALAVPCAVLLSAYMAGFGGLFALLAHDARRLSLPLLPQAILLALGWYLLEWTRGWLFSGFAWTPLAAAFAPVPPLIQGASILGAYGLSGFFAGLSCLAGLGLERGGRRGWAAFAAALALFLGAWCAGSASMGRQDLPGRTVDVLLVQGNINQDVKWSPAMLRATVRRYIELTQGALARLDARGETAFAVWPETAMPFDAERERALVLPLKALAKSASVELAFGAIGFDRASGKYLNRANFISANGQEAGSYDKQHLVPFGEYAPPFLDFPFLESLFQAVGAFVPGREPAGPRMRAFDTGQGQAALVPGMLICYESIFPELARQRVADGADALVNISNDAWFGRTSAPVQHLHTSLLRSVEFGRPLLRATNTGISAFIDARGRILSQSPLFTAATLHARIAPGSGSTAFFHLAPWMPGLAAALFAALWLPAWLHQRRRTPPQGTRSCSSSPN